MRRPFSRPALAAVAALAALGFSASAASDAEAVRRLGRLQAWLDGTRTLEARFEQAIVSGALGSGVLERGRLWIERPGRMRWDYREPETKIALLDGERTTLFLDSDRELLLGRLDESGGLLPALLAGGRPLVELFEASLPEDGEDGVTLVLRPRGDEPGLERVDLVLAGRDGAIEWVRILDSTGQRIELRLSGIRRNATLPRAIFDFEPPPGTVVRGSHDPVEPAPAR